MTTVEDRAETGVTSASVETKKKDMKNTTTDHVEMTCAISRMKEEGESTNDEPWIAVASKRKKIRFQDMSGLRATH